MAIESMTECAVMLKALGDPTRLSVVRQLVDRPGHVGDLNTEIGVEPSLLSHHLRVLRDAGIVEAERDGKGVLYRLSPAFRLRTNAAGVDFGCCQLTF